MCAVGAALAVGGLLRRPPPPLSALVDAAWTARMTEPRLTGGFAFAPMPSPPSRGAGGVPWRVLAVAGQVRDAVNTSPTPANLHALGLAALLAQRHDEAVLALEDALASDGLNAAYHSDVAAAYLTRLAHGGPAIDLAKALVAADRAVRLAPRLAEAHLNRALALSALHLRHEATLAWDEYLRGFGHEAGWSEEATRRRDAEAREPTPLAPSPAAVADTLLEEWAAVAVQTPDAAFLPALSSADAFTPTLPRRLARPAAT